MTASARSSDTTAPPSAGLDGPKDDGRAGRFSWSGVRTVTSLELRQRVRTSRWPIVLGLWCLVVYGIAGLTWLALRGVVDDPAAFSEGMTATQMRGNVLFGVSLFFVLGLSLLVMPSLTASSINGDREHGVLATLQTTLLSPAEIVAGKLLAAWALAALFLATTLPLLVFAVLSGGVSVGGLALTIFCLFAVLAAVCALGLLFSAITARTVTSVVLTYLTVALLSVGTVIAFGVAMPLTERTDTYRVYSMEPAATELPQDDPTAEPEVTCQWTTQEREEVHTERIWWLLIPNPFVIVADAAPAPTSREARSSSPLASIGEAIRRARLGQPETIDECYRGTYIADQDTAQDQVGATWPYGLILMVLTAAGASAVAVRRLRAPVRTLPRGVRIA